jgi:hypothetical protein
MLKGHDYQDPKEFVDQKSQNQLIQEILDSSIDRLEILLKLNTVQNVKEVKFANDTNAYFMFHNSADVRSYNKSLNAARLNPLDYNPLKLGLTKMKIEDNNDDIKMKDINLTEKEEEEEENSDDFEINICDDVIPKNEIEVTAPILGRKRYYQAFSLFSTQVIDTDPKVRRRIKNSKENNFWNILAENVTKKTEWINIIWFKDFEEIQDMKKLIHLDVHGVIAAKINKSLSLTAACNALFFDGTCRDLLLAKGIAINVDNLINQEQVHTEILIREKKWKILKFRVEEKKEKIVWRPKPRKKTTFMKCNFEPIDLDEHGLLAN